MWVKVGVLVGLALAAGVAAVVVLGARRWEAETRDLRSGLEAARLPIHPRVFDVAELEHLPGPVQRYFRAVLKDGQPIVAAATVQHTGTFNMSDTGEQWKLFTSTQRVIARRPGFDWDARVAMMPGVPVHVHDAYVTGEGILHAAVYGLFTVANLRGTPEAAQGELMRFLAEAVWYPTALLPSQGVHWDAVDDTSARAAMTDGIVTVAILFRFNEAGVVESMRAESRGRIVNGTVMATPWEGRVSHYEWRDGMQVPLEGEVAWAPADGPRPYWRGRIAAIRYEFAH